MHRSGFGMNHPNTAPCDELPTAACSHFKMDDLNGAKLSLFRSENISERSDLYTIAKK